MREENIKKTGDITNVFQKWPDCLQLKHESHRLLKIKIGIIGIILLLLASSSYGGNEQKISYKHYVNTRFSYSISYPEGILFPQGESANGDGWVGQRGRW